MFKNILVAVDGSEHAQRGLDEAVDIARGSKGTLTLVTAVPDPTALALGGGFAYPVDYESFDAELKSDYRELLDKEKARVPDDVESRALLLEGRPSRAIVAQAKAGQGGRGHGRTSSRGGVVPGRGEHGRRTGVALDAPQLRGLVPAHRGRRRSSSGNRPLLLRLRLHCL